jgi:hypothetical protein
MCVSPLCVVMKAEHLRPSSRRDPRVLLAEGVLGFLDPSVQQDRHTSSRSPDSQSHLGHPYTRVRMARAGPCWDGTARWHQIETRFSSFSVYHLGFNVSIDKCCNLLSGSYGGLSLGLCRRRGESRPL